MSKLENSADLHRLDFAKSGGLVIVVTQDDRTGSILMVAHADREALERTLASGEMHYLSRTRGPWHKGATSGNVQRLVSLNADCDGDAVLARVIPAGPACHTGATTCFDTESAPSNPSPFADVLDRLDATIRDRAMQSPDGKSYTRRLLDDRNLRLKKLGEEAAELVLACADEDRDRAINEAADLVYHALVALRSLDLGIDNLRATLARRS